VAAVWLPTPRINRRQINRGQITDRDKLGDVPAFSNGYEWCVNAPVIDFKGLVYVTSEDGHVYSLPQGRKGILKKPHQKIFLKEALGAAYTPLSIAEDGRVYGQNDLLPCFRTKLSMICAKERGAGHSGAGFLTLDGASSAAPRKSAAPSLQHFTPNTRITYI
jgi:hypothetical protein